MHDSTRHPADDELFDYATGALDPAAVAAMEQHLLRCAACAGFVAASREGAAALGELVEPMPAAAAADLQLAVDAAWRERREAIAALERAQDAVSGAASAAATEHGGSSSPGVEDSIDAAPVEVPAPVVGPGRVSRWRRAMPVFAVAVLAVLAGTSVWLGRDDATVTVQGTDRSGAAESADAPAVSADVATSESAGVPDAGAGAAVPPAGAPESGVGGAQADTTSKATDAAAGAPIEDGATSTSTMPPPTGVTADEVCIATLDETDLSLPDGRLAARILEGPLGLYVVCG